MTRDRMPANSAVLLTPPQPGAIATIRMTGPQVDTFANQHLSVSPKLSRAIHCALRDGETLIDDPVAVLLSAECLELHLHGGPWILRATLELLERFGFTVRPWESAGDIWIDAGDPIERQVLADIHCAGTREALTILLSQPTAWRAMLASQDADVIRRAKADRSLALLLSPPTVAIVGLPNVGKSTLANQLFARSRSITADLPGTTRDWVGERANIDGLIVTLIDTPGQRATDDPIEAVAIENAIEHVGSAELVLLVEDATQSIDEKTEVLRERYANAIRVLNKADLAGARTDQAAIRISAQTGEGLPELRHAILSAFGGDELGSLHARCWTDDQKKMLADFR